MVETVKERPSAWISRPCRGPTRRCRARRESRTRRRGGDEARQDADQRPEPPFGRGGYGEAHGCEAQPGVKHQQKSKRDSRLPRVTSRQQSRSRERAEDNARQHGPKPARQAAETWARRGLPDVGDERRHDQERRGFGGRHHEAEQAHRDGRQPEPDHPLHEAGEEEGEGCDDKRERSSMEGIAPGTMRRDWRSLPGFEKISVAPTRGARWVAATRTGRSR